MLIMKKSKSNARSSAAQVSVEQVASVQAAKRANAQANPRTARIAALNAAVNERGGTREEILTLGSEAATLLSAPVFNEAYRMTMDQIVEQWLTSETPESREALWHQAQNLAEVTRALLAHVNAAQAINLSEEELAEQDLNRWEDEQGFH